MCEKPLKRHINYSKHHGVCESHRPSNIIQCIHCKSIVPVLITQSSDEEIKNAPNKELFLFSESCKGLRLGKTQKILRFDPQQNKAPRLINSAKPLDEPFEKKTNKMIENLLEIPHFIPSECKNPEFHSQVLHLPCSKIGQDDKQRDQRLMHCEDISQDEGFQGITENLNHLVLLNDDFRNDEGNNGLRIIIPVVSVLIIFGISILLKLKNKI
jgi:hypothetical protein